MAMNDRMWTDIWAPIRINNYLQLFVKSKMADAVTHQPF